MTSLWVCPHQSPTSPQHWKRPNTRKKWLMPDEWKQNATQSEQRQAKKLSCAKTITIENKKSRQINDTIRTKTSHNTLLHDRKQTSNFTLTHYKDVQNKSNDNWIHAKTKKQCNLPYDIHQRLSQHHLHCPCHPPERLSQRAFPNRPDFNWMERA